MVGTYKTRRKGHLRVRVPGVARLGPSGVAFYAQRARLPPVSSTATSTFPLPGGICDFAGPSQPARGDLSCGSTGKASASPHQARIKTTRTRHIACGSRTKVEYRDPVVPGPPGRSGVYRYVIILASGHRTSELLSRELVLISMPEVRTLIMTTL